MGQSVKRWNDWIESVAIVEEEEKKRKEGMKEEKKVAQFYQLVLSTRAYYFICINLLYL